MLLSCLAQPTVIAHLNRRSFPRLVSAHLVPGVLQLSSKLAVAKAACQKRRVTSEPAVLSRCMLPTCHEGVRAHVSRRPWGGSGQAAQAPTCNLDSSRSRRKIPTCVRWRAGNRHFLVQIADGCIRTSLFIRGPFLNGLTVTRWQQGQVRMWLAAANSPRRIAEKEWPRAA